MPSACERVFGTAELLEAILLEIQSPKSLLVVQAVSPSFRKAVTMSPPIRHQLFFKAERIGNPLAWRLNPLLREPFIPFFVVPTSQYWSFQPDCMPNYEAMQIMSWTKTQQRNAFLDRKASWRKMLVIQPPPKELTIIRITKAGEDGACEWKATLPCDTHQHEGVTMGILYDIVESFVTNEDGHFGLTVRNSDSGPEITIYLRYSPFNKSANNDLYMSQGAEMTWDHESIQWVNTGRLDGQRGRFVGLFTDPAPETDLSSERGGVERDEWIELNKRKAVTSRGSGGRKRKRRG